MKIFSLGVDQLTVNEIKLAGYTVIPHSSLPDSVHTGQDMLMVTSEAVPVSALGELRTNYPQATILYLYLQKGVRGYQSVHLLCESLGIFFVPPRSTSGAIIEKLRFILAEDSEERLHVVGFFGSGPGVGCTSTARLFAKRLAAAGQKVILLGLDLYDPGYDRKTAVSLDRLRPRLTGKMLHAIDFETLVKLDGYAYLPGNYDYLAAQDYREEEIEYLLSEAGKYADVLIADCGSIPESAAWYVGMQCSALRMLVTHPRHEQRLQPLMELAGHMDLHPQDFQWIINRSTAEELLSPKNLVQRFGCEMLLELPYYPGYPENLPLGKRELQHLDDKINALLVTLGLTPELRKKGVIG